jgi:glutamate-1-semialdehyde aminotransferase
VIAGAPRFLDALDGGPWSFGDDSFPAVGVTYFAGTFVRHPLALTAAKAVLTHLRAEGNGLQERVNALASHCVAELERVCRELGAPVRFAHFSSAFQPSFTTEAPFGGLLFPLLRERGIHMFEGRTWFLTAAHTEADVAFLVDAFHDAVGALLDVGLLPRAASGNGAHASAASSGPGAPPTPDARLGRDPAGRPGWYRPDPDRPGKFLRIGD